MSAGWFSPPTWSLFFTRNNELRNQSCLGSKTIIAPFLSMSWTSCSTISVNSFVNWHKFGCLDYLSDKIEFGICKREFVTSYCIHEHRIAYLFLPISYKMAFCTFENSDEERQKSGELTQGVIDEYTFLPAGHCYCKIWLAAVNIHLPLFSLVLDMRPGVFEIAILDFHPPQDAPSGSYPENFGDQYTGLGPPKYSCVKNV